MERKVLKSSQTIAGVQRLLALLGVVFALYVAGSSFFGLPFNAASGILLSMSIYLLGVIGFFQRSIQPKTAELALTVVTGMVASYLGAKYVVALYAVLVSRASLGAGQNQTFQLAVVIGALHAAVLAMSDGLLTTGLLLRVAFDWLLLACLTVTAAYLGYLLTMRQQGDQMIAQLAHDSERQRQKARTDELTGLYNYRAYQEAADRLPRYVLLIVDLDKFKLLNDTYGHGFGNEVLIRMGLLIKQTVRSTGMAFRYGGEEFVIILPNVQSKQANAIAEGLRQMVADRVFRFADQPITVTVSIGASIKAPCVSSQRCFELADKALYSAKRRGRNNVQWSLPPELQAEA